jgi:thiopurine S-methyltransferase
MHHDFWHDKWHRKEIGFHQQSINQYLKTHWNEMPLANTDTVFVPLCGKSKDIFWINDKGHPVIGIELSPLACKDLFEEAGVSAEVTPGPDFSHYRHNDIHILCGDFFRLSAEDTRLVRAVYDRAALIALPAEMRKTYVEHLNHILPRHCHMLLVSMNYPQTEMSGPPFSVNDDEISSLYAPVWQIRKLTENILGKDDPFAKRRGLSELKETAWLLSRQD